MKHIGHLTFHSRSVLSDTGMPGAILSYNAIATGGLSGHNYVKQK